MHVSAAEALPLLAAARGEGLAITAETCPHYLALAAEDVPAGATEYKCCPPIRDRANRELLWEGLRAGVLDCVVSDHSPCPPELKQAGGGDFGAAWGGIASVQLALPVVWTYWEGTGLFPGRCRPLDGGRSGEDSRLACQGRDRGRPRR